MASNQSDGLSPSAVEPILPLTSAAVLGTGGVGGCLAAILASKGVQVTCVDRDATVDAIRSRGLRLESRMFGNVTVHPVAVERLEHDTDLLFIATKAYHLDSALDRIESSCLRRAVVVPLLNGLEHMDRIRERVGRRVAAGSIRIVTSLTEVAHVVHTSPFVIVTLASDRDVAAGRLGALAEALTGLGIQTKVAENEVSVLWDKIVRLAALACTTSLTGRTIGDLRRDAHWREVLEVFVREAAAVAGAEGAATDAEAQMAVIDSLPETMTSSMQRDIAAGRPSELDAIAGAVVRAGARHGITCPTIRDLIQRIEKEHGVRPADGTGTEKHSGEGYSCLTR